VQSTHVGYHGTYITSRQASAASATVDIVVQVENAAGSGSVDVQVATDIHIYNLVSGKAGDKVAEFPKTTVSVQAGQLKSTNASAVLQNPRLWGPFFSNLLP